MSNWNLNNIASVTLWGYLGFRNEISGTFDACGGKTISEFSFWNSASTQALNRIAAEALAKDVHHHFGMLLQAPYENASMTYAKAIASLTDVLSDASKTVADLAKAVDDLFEVPGEE